MIANQAGGLFARPNSARFERCQPDVTCALLVWEHQLVWSDRQLNARETIGIKASPRLMKVLDHERLALRAFGCGIQPLRPEATESVPFGEEVHQRATRRPDGLAIGSVAVRDRNPARLGRGLPAGHWRNEDLPLCLSDHGLKQHPAVVG